MKKSDLEFEKIEKNLIKGIMPLFKPKSKLHTKWYGIRDYDLCQYGSLKHLINSTPEQILCETYDHDKPTTIVVLFFDKDFGEQKGIFFPSGWVLGKRFWANGNDKNFQLTDPNGVVKNLQLNSNLYSKVFKSAISKLIKTQSS